MAAEAPPRARTIDPVIEPMDAARVLLDIFLHTDRHLTAVALSHGPWVYALLFAIVTVSLLPVAWEAPRASSQRSSGARS